MTIKSLIQLLWSYDPDDLVYIDKSGLIVHEINFDIDSSIELENFDGDIDEQYNY